MRKKVSIVILLLCLLVPVLLVVYAYTALGGTEEKANLGEKTREEKSVMKTRFETFTFDNSRFFCPRTRDVGELGDEGWAKITAKGRREYLAEIDPGRCAGYCGYAERAVWARQFRRESRKIQPRNSQTMEPAYERYCHSQHK